MTVLFVLLWSSHDYEQLLRETCMAFPRHQLLQILDDYEQSRGNASIISYFRNVRIMSGFVLMSPTIAEIIIYFIFFHYIYIHGNGERLRRLLEPTVIKLRNRTNAITFFGQFCSFVFELSSAIFIICALKGWGEAWGVIFVLKLTCFTSISMIEVFTSGTLRPRLFTR